MSEALHSGGSRIFARGCGSWCLWSAPSPFMPSLPPTVKKISWELAAIIIIIVLSAVLTVFEIGRP